MANIGEVKRSATGLLTAVNGGSSNRIVVNSPDDDLDRVLTGIFVPPQAAAGAQIVLYKAQREICTFDSLRFSAAFGSLPLAELYKLGYWFVIQLINNSGGDLANIPVRLEYMVPRQ